MTLDENVVILESATSLFESASRLLMVENTSGFSRKSLTAHYHPISFKQGGGGVETSVGSDSYNKSIITTMSKMRKFDNLPIYTFNRWETTKSSLKGLIKYFTGFKNSENSLMQRDAYDFKKSR